MGTVNPVFSGPQDRRTYLRGERLFVVVISHIVDIYTYKKFFKGDILSPIETWF